MSANESLRQVGWYDEEEVEFRYLSQGGQPTWGAFVPVFVRVVGTVGTTEEPTT